MSTPKNFETVMHHTLAHWLRLNSGASDNVMALFDKLGDEAERALLTVGRISDVVLEQGYELPLHPDVWNAVTAGGAKGKAKAKPKKKKPKKKGTKQNASGGASTAEERVQSVKKVIARMMQVGSENSPDADKAYAFMPTASDNIGFDHYVVLPKVGGGRVILAFQDKEWFELIRQCPETGERRHAVKEARFGRQYFLKDTVRSKTKPKARPVPNANEACPMPNANEACPMPNVFWSLLQEAYAKSDGPTDFVSVVVTPGVVDFKDMNAGTRTPGSTMADMETGDVLPDEGMISLVGLQRVCPTVGYAAYGAFKLRSMLPAEL